MTRKRPRTPAKAIVPTGCASAAPNRHRREDRNGRTARQIGRHRKPAAIRKAEGKRGHRPIPNEPKPVGSPTMPDYFDDEEKRLWIAALAHLPKGIIGAADTAFLEVFVVSWQTLRSCRRDINRIGLMVKGGDGQPIRNPLLGIARGAAADLHLFGADLAMSPAARTKLIAVDDGEIDPMELLLGMDGWSGEIPTQ